MANAMKVAARMQKTVSANQNPCTPECLTKSFPAPEPVKAVSSALYRSLLK